MAQLQRNETSVRTKYAQNPRSMQQSEYLSAFFVCRKPSDDDVPRGHLQMLVPSGDSTDGLNSCFHMPQKLGPSTSTKQPQQ